MYKKNPHLVGEAINDAITIFEYAKGKNLKVVYASSSSVYNGNAIPYQEDMPVFVTDYYTECRYAIERLARLYNTLFGLKSVGLRFFSEVGKRWNSSAAIARSQNQRSTSRSAARASADGRATITPATANPSFSLIWPALGTRKRRERKEPTQNLQNRSEDRNSLGWETS